MKRAFACLSFLAILLTPCFSVFPDNPDTDMKAVGRLTTFDGSQWVTSGSAVAISPYWIIQVSHATGTHFEQEGQRYQILQGFAHHDPNGDADLILARVDGPLKYAAPMSFRSFSGANGLEGLTAKLCGFGYTGNRISTGWNIQAGTQGTRRSAFNAIDTFIPAVQVDIGGGVTKTSDCIFYDLDDPQGQNTTNVSGGTAVPGEGGIASWDSGGGMFVLESGLWRLVAITAYVGTFDGTGVVNWNDFGGVGGGPIISSYQNWIQSTVPDLGRAILNSIQLEFGSSVVSGSLIDVEQSDDARLEVQGTNLTISNAISPFGVIIHGTTTAAPATSIDLKIEGKVNGGLANASVALKHWNTGSFETVHTYQLGATEGVENITGIPAGDFVGADGSIELRIRANAIINSSTFIRLAFDQIRIDAH